jgi:outer membrane lipoprotein SlyB
MKTIFSLSVIAALGLNSCAYNDPYASNTSRDATTGALLGGAVGGVVGHQSGEGAAGAAIGAALGGLYGASVGSQKDRARATYGPPPRQQNYYGSSYGYGGY